MLCAALRRELDTVASRRAFCTAQGRRTILARYPTLVAALEEIVGLNGAYGRADEATVDEFFRDVLDEQREFPHRVWPTAVMVAFFPAITKLKLRARSSAHDEDGLRDLVLDGCLEAIKQVGRESHRDRLPMRLKQAMQRHVFTAIRAACSERELVSNLVTAALATRSVEPFAHGRGELVPHVGELLVEIREATRDAHEGDDFELARRLDDASSLLERLRMLYPDAPDEDIAQMYERLKKRVSRAFARVRSAAEQAALEAAQPTRRRTAPRRRRKATRR
jgi:hypothetical protein